MALLVRKWSIRGGNERVATDLARTLIERGHAVSVYCQKMDASAEGIVPESSIHRVPGVSFDPVLAMLTFAWSCRRIVRSLRRGRAVDVVVGFNHSVDQDVYRLGAGTHAEFLALTRDVPAARGGPILDRAALFLERHRFAQGRYVKLIAPSHRVADELERHYGVRKSAIAVIPNGIDLARFAPLNDGGVERALVRSRWGVLESERVALFVGQELERKGFWVAVEVARRVACRLVVVGKARRPKELPPHVVWDGERLDVERCYRAADAFLLPSYYDPFGGAVLEAFAAGIPVVATDRIGATERASGTVLASFLVSSPEDVDSLALKLQDALRSERRSELKEAALLAAHGADRTVWGARIESLLEEVALTKPPRS